MTKSAQKGTFISPMDSSKANDAFQIQMELTELRNRVKLLDGGTGRCELLDLLSERDEEIKKKDDQLRILNGKFHQITRGLSQIEQERQSLRKSAADLEAQKKKVQRHLDIREKEVMALVQRCGAQEEKMKEAANLRASNTTLEEEVAQLKETLQSRDTEAAELAKIDRILKETQAERDDTLARLEKLKKDHDAVVDNLNASFVRIKKMTDVFAEREEEFERKLEKKTRDFEQERVVRMGETKKVKEDLRSSQRWVKEIEGRLRDRDEIVKGLRNEISESEKKHEEEVSVLTMDFEKQQSAVAKNQEEQIRAIESARDKALKKLSSLLDEKDAALSSCKQEVSRQGEKMGCLEQELEHVRHKQEEERSRQCADLEQLRSENTGLLQQLAAKGAEVLELTDAQQESQKQNRALAEESQQLKKKVDELEGLTALIPDMEEQLQRVGKNVAELRHQKTQLEEESSATKLKLNKDLQMSRTNAAEMEKRLNEELNSIRKERDAQEQKLKMELTQKSGEIETLAIDLARQEELLEELKTNLEHLQSKSSEDSLASQTEIQRLNTELKDAKDSVTLLQRQLQECQSAAEKEFSSHREEIVKLKADLEQSNGTILHLQARLEEVQSTSKKASLSNQREVDRLQQDVANAMCTLSDKERTISELREKSGEKITSLEGQVIQLNEKVATSELQAAEIVADLENQMKELQTKNATLNEKAIDAENEHNRVHELLQTELSTVRGEKTELEAEMKAQRKKAQERNATISQLLKKRNSQEETLKSLHENLDLSIAARNELQKRVVDMELEMDRERTRFEEDALEFHRENEKLLDELNDLDKKVEDTSHARATAEATLKERMILLSDMVEQNKELEKDLQESRGLVADLQEESNRYLREREQAESVVAKKKKEMELKEDEYLRSVQSERHLRDMAEADLQAAKKALENAKRNSKDYAELEKENIVLKDKVLRQEAYLKRKLEKEKVQKVRSLGRSTKHNQDPAAMSSPKTKARSSNREPLRKSQQGTVVTETSSFPGEIEEDQI